MDDKLKSDVQAWLDRVDEDLKVAKTLLKAAPDTTGAISFHAQQLVEKALKAYLTLNRRHIDKIHDLKKILRDCAKIDPEFMSFIDDAADVTTFGGIARYPDNWRAITKEESRDVMMKAERILKFVRSKLDPTLLI